MKDCYQKQKAPELFPIQKKYAYKLVFQSIQVDENGIPIYSVSKVTHCYPTNKELSKLQTNALRSGYKLVSVSRFNQSSKVDEF